MSIFCVTGGEMDDKNLSDADVENLIAGQPVDGVGIEVVDLVTELRAEYVATPHVTASPLLAEFLHVADLTPVPSRSFRRP